MVWSEGSLERDYLRLLEFDPEVIAYHEQPLLVEYWYWPDGTVRLTDEGAEVPDSVSGAKRTKYHPDFLVERRENPPMVVEVKNERFLIDPATKRKLAAARLLAEQQGWELRVVTEEIRRGPMLTNLRILGRYANLRIPNDVKLAVLRNMMSLSRTFTVRELAGRLVEELGGESSTYEGLVYALVSRWELGLDLKIEIIGPHSVVNLTSGGTHSGAGAATAGRTVLVQE
jgi:hypothetical protein